MTAIDQSYAWGKCDIIINNVREGVGNATYRLILMVFWGMLQSQRATLKLLLM